MIVAITGELLTEEDFENQQDFDQYVEASLLETIEELLNHWLYAKSVTNFGRSETVPNDQWEIIAHADGHVSVNTRSNVFRHPNAVGTISELQALKQAGASNEILIKFMRGMTETERLCTLAQLIETKDEQLRLCSGDSP